MTYDLTVFPFHCLSSKEILRTGREGPLRCSADTEGMRSSGLMLVLGYLLPERSVFSFWSLCFLLASSVVWGPFSCSGKCSGCDSPDNTVSPSSCWLQTLTRLSRPLLDQWATPTPVLSPDHLSLQNWPRGGPQPYNAAPILPKNWRLAGKSTIRASLPNCKTKRLQQAWDCYPKVLLARLALGWYLWTWI